MLHIPLYAERADRRAILASELRDRSDAGGTRQLLQQQSGSCLRRGSLGSRPTDYELTLNTHAGAPAVGGGGGLGGSGSSRINCRPAASGEGPAARSTAAVTFDEGARNTK